MFVIIIGTLITTHQAYAYQPS